MIIVKRNVRRRGNAAAIVRAAGLSRAASGSGDNRIQLVQNGTFASDTLWTKTTWTIAAGVANIAGAATDAMTQSIAITPGLAYLVTFTVTAFTAGTVTPILGGTSGMARGSAATFSEIIMAGSTNNLINFSASAATLSIDNITILQMG